MRERDDSERRTQNIKSPHPSASGAVPRNVWPRLGESRSRVITWHDPLSQILPRGRQMTDKLRSVADRLQLRQFEENMEYAMLILEYWTMFEKWNLIPRSIWLKISPMSHEPTTAIYNKIYSYGVYIDWTCSLSCATAPIVIDGLLYITMTNRPSDQKRRQKKKQKKKLHPINHIPSPMLTYRTWYYFPQYSKSICRAYKKTIAIKPSKPPDTSE